MKKFLLIFSMVFCFIACEEVKPLTESELPATIQTFISEHFPDDKVDVIVYERECCETTYNIILASGFQLEFDKKGICEKIDCKPQSIPSSIIPASALQYVESHFQNAVITSYELVSKNKFKLELQNDIELLFNNKEGQFIKMDD